MTVTKNNYTVSDYVRNHFGSHYYTEVSVVLAPTVQIIFYFSIKNDK